MSGTHVSLVVAVHFPGSARALACWRWRLAIANLLEFWSFVRVVTRRMFRRGHPFGYAQDRLHLHARRVRFLIRAIRVIRGSSCFVRVHSWLHLMPEFLNPCCPYDPR